MTTFKAIQGAPLLLFCAVLILGCGSEASGEEPEGQPETEGLSSASIRIDDFQMTWSVEESNLEISASAPTTGWVAVGFEPSAAMKDADIVIGYVAGGEVYLRDDWGDNYTSHKADIDLGGTDDVTAVSGYEDGGFTGITFSIPLSSGDQYDHVLEEGGTYTVILAYGSNDADDFDGLHEWVETVEIELGQ
ncbi:MAG: DOMON domain-containing protein [Candidatus Fermentibacteria bacterium]